MNMLLNRKYCSQILLFCIQSFLTVWWRKKIFLLLLLLFSNSSLRILANCHFMLQKYWLQPGTSETRVSSLTGSFLLFSVCDVKKKNRLLLFIYCIWILYLVKTGLSAFATSFVFYSGAIWYFIGCIHF